MQCYTIAINQTTMWYCYENLSTPRSTPAQKAVLLSKPRWKRMTAFSLVLHTTTYCCSSWSFHLQKGVQLRIHGAQGNCSRSFFVFRSKSINSLASYLSHYSHTVLLCSLLDVIVFSILLNTFIKVLFSAFTVILKINKNIT